MNDYLPTLTIRTDAKEIISLSNNLKDVFPRLYPQNQEDIINGIQLWMEWKKLCGTINTKGRDGKKFNLKLNSLTVLMIRKYINTDQDPELLPLKIEMDKFYSQLVFKIINKTSTQWD